MTYPQAPITEAVIDIRVTPREGLNVEEFRTLAKNFGDEFGTQNDQLRLATVIVPGQSAVQPVAPTKTGIQFVANSKDKLFQAQIDGWSFNKLAPYRGWEEEFRDDARRLWNGYRAIAQPQKITRAALRYVNRLDLPAPVSDLSTYLRTGPEISSDLPQAVDNFYLQLQIPQADVNALLIINMSIVPPPKEGIVSIVLDLDLFQATDVPQTEIELWNCFERLRIRKNQIFEACVTDATRELFR
jgi:uncharacterized protein (TIGR04255 family)